MKPRHVLLSVLLSACSAARTPPGDVTGTWRVTITTAADTITGMASLKQTGDLVSGWVGPDERNPIPIAGFLTANRLTMKTFPQPGRTVAFDRCDLSVNEHKMLGTIEGGDTRRGAIEFVQTRP
jgi:hypothetical protein